jgi:hypothetical protein
MTMILILLINFKISVSLILKEDLIRSKTGKKF